MNSNWVSEIRGVLRKELLCERRDKSASYTASMLSICTVFALAFAFFGRTLPADAGSGLLWVALLFSGVGTLARSFVAEDEMGTGDLLRLWARPEAVFWGKLIFAFMQMAFTSAIVALMFVILTGLKLTNLPILVLSLFGGSLALSCLVTLVSALISRGSNRGTLVGVVSLPLLLPLIALGVTATHGAFEVTAERNGWNGVIGVFLYAILTLAVAPYQFAFVWREQP